jgi:fucose permease
LPVDEPHPEQRRAEPVHRRRRRWINTSVLALGAANAMAVTLDITSGDWATFRLTDDLHATASTAIVALVGFTAGMTIGRLSGDFVLVRVGRARLAQLGAATGGIGLAIATLVPDRWIAIAGFAVSGLGTSVLAPQLADAAARAPGPPGSGFKTLFIGHRMAALSVPIAIGVLANTTRLSVGVAMAIIGIPTAAVLAATAHRAVVGTTQHDAT